MSNVSRKFDPINCNYTTWTPETCNCVITVEWDKSTGDRPNEMQVRPVHEDVKIIGSDGNKVDHINKCNEHWRHTESADHFKVVLEENQRKNRAHSELNEGKEQIEWYWDGKSPNRVLHIKGHTGKNEIKLQGHGKVVLD